MAELKPYVNIGPGDMIKDELEALGWTQEDLAGVMGMSLKAVNEILNNKSAITVETARLLARALGTSPELWLNLDTAYRLRASGETEREREAERYSSVMKYMPVREMVKKGWMNGYDSAAVLFEEVKSFWEVREPDLSFLAEHAAPCFRRSRSREAYENFYALAWTHRARTLARTRTLGPYNETRSTLLGDSISRFSSHEDGVSLYIRALEEAGIGFFVLSHLQKTYLDGAAIFVGSNPFIVYTGRYDRCDNFWFTLAHELAHIILGHVRKEGDEVLDDLKDDAESAEEKAADELAERYIRKPEILSFCMPFKQYLSRERIKRCASELGVHPGIVVGTLQHAGLLSYTNLNDFKYPVLDTIPASQKLG